MVFMPLVSSIYFFKIPWIRLKMSRRKVAGDMDRPATSEKSEPEGKADGSTSGIDTGRNIASREATFENE
jgi:hypothetical protein